MQWVPSDCCAPGNVRACRLAKERRECENSDNSISQSEKKRATEMMEEPSVKQMMTTTDQTERDGL